MQIEMAVISLEEKRTVDDVPVFQVKLYGVDREHGAIFEFAQPDNAMEFALKKTYRVTVEAT